MEDPRSYRTCDLDDNEGEQILPLPSQTTTAILLPNNPDIVFLEVVYEDDESQEFNIGNMLRPALKQKEFFVD